MDIDTQSAAHPLITDSFLLSILQTTHSARDAALHLLFVTSTPPASSDPATSDDTITPPPTDISHALAITRAQKPLFTHLAHLRGQNRKLAHRLRDTKAATSTSRAEVDTLHLSLQNLYYESRHLAGEIAAAEGYQHKYRHLPLISEDEFLDTHPEWKERRRRQEMAEMGMSDTVIEETTKAHPLMQKMGHWRPQPDSVANSPREPFAYRPSGVAKDEIYSHNRDGSESPSVESVGSGLTPALSNHGHASAIVVEDQAWNEEEFMKARIEAEYQERVQLDEQRKKLLTRKMELVKENAKRKEELGKLDKELEAFIEAAKPIQKTFEKDL